MIKCNNIPRIPSRDTSPPLPVIFRWFFTPKLTDKHLYTHIHTQKTIYCQKKKISNFFPFFHFKKLPWEIKISWECQVKFFFLYVWGTNACHGMSRHFFPINLQFMCVCVCLCVWKSLEIKKCYFSFSNFSSNALSCESFLNVSWGGVWKGIKSVDFGSLTEAFLCINKHKQELFLVWKFIHLTFFCEFCGKLLAEMSILGC